MNPLLPVMPPFRQRLFPRQHATRERLVAPISRGGKEEAQEETSRPESQLLLHGCEMSRMLQDHDGVQPRSDSGAVRWLLHSPVSAHWRQSTSHRGVLIQEEAALVVVLEAEGGEGNGPVDISVSCL
uniref:40S ribosomal protein S27 n=1 Tax=Nothobranchius kuhntae TaxID=321403 RepID=A0A1A8JJ11_NOTKU